MSSPTVYIVDDDPAICKSLARLCESVDLHTETYASATDFLAHFAPDRPGCLVLDMRMPGLGGLELQQQLVARNARLPVIILTGFGDVPSAVQAMRAGAFDFVEKPFTPQVLLDRINQALARDAAQRATEAGRARYAALKATLSKRELDVLQLLVEGKSVKNVAALLGLSHKTVQVHRAHIMQKMQATTLAELVRFSLLAEGADAR